MKKSLLSLALFSAFCSSAIADSVVVYGVVDAGVVSESGPLGSVVKLTSGVQSGSRLGFKGTEDLGGGLRANFVVEGGFGVDTGTSLQGGVLFGRQSFVGLSNKIGAVTFGRQQTALYNTLRDIGDPFAIGLAGTSTNLMSTGGNRLNNTVRLSSEPIANFSGDVSYSLGEVAGNSRANRSFGGSFGYANGPAALRIAHNNTSNVLGSDSAKTTLLAGSYDFGVVKANLAYAENRGAGNIDSRDVLIGGSVPFGASKVTASYIHKNDRSFANNDAHQFGIGYEYALSERTNIYTSYAAMSNSNTGAYTIGNATDVGSGDRALNAGVRHKF